jgi:hypothetical protein
MKLFFLDDSGNPSIKSKNRYFAFGGFSINADEINSLRSFLAQRWGAHPDLGHKSDELKLSFIGNQSTKALAKNPLHRIGLTTLEQRNFVLETLVGLTQFKTLEVIVSVVDKNYAFGMDNKEHGFRTLLERIQKASEDKNEDFLLICDEEQQHNKIMREVLHEQKSLYLNFTRIQETILFAPSVLSPGIQFADLIVGSVTRMLNHQDMGYFEVIVPLLRRAPWNNANWQGYGLALFPSQAWHDLKSEAGGLVPKATGFTSPSQSY